MGPQRLQLIRTKGFGLQKWSRELNGLAAVKVDRSTRWGNVYRVGLVACGCRAAGECSCNTFNRESAEEAVQAFREIPRSERRLAEIREVLGGKNLACWCALYEPCHADVLLELANGPL